MEARERDGWVGRRRRTRGWTGGGVGEDGAGCGEGFGRGWWERGRVDEGLRGEGDASFVFLLFFVFFELLAFPNFLLFELLAFRFLGFVFPSLASTRLSFSYPLLSTNLSLPLSLHRPSRCFVFVYSFFAFTLSHPSRSLTRIHTLS